MRLTGHGLAQTPDWWEWGHMFAAANAGKRGITLDVGTDGGRTVLRRLVQRADVLVENFSPRVTESWGLDHTSVLALNPRIVHVRMPAFGLTGPWRDRPAFAQIIEPMSSMASVTGFPDGPPIAKGGLPDPLAGAHGAFAALVGLARRRRSGRGVAVESVMFEVAVNAAAQPLLEQDAYGCLQGRTGNRSPHAAPQGVYSCADGQWLAVSVPDDTAWRALAGALGAPEWADDPALADLAGRRQQHDRLDGAISAWAAGQQAEDAARLLLEVGVPASPCRDPRGISAHPHLVARGLYEELDHPVVGRHVVPGAPYRFASVDRWLHRPAPTFGQHTAEVLAEWLWMSPEEIGALAEGVTATRPRGL
jgi:crotonobetainyl-CoA:carnitine CoA-transferase CaiB-like acyl-CoA transferase